MGLKKIKLLLTDVDGILTNGKVYMGEKDEYIGFDIQDGIAHRLASSGGLKVGWLTGRISKPVARRAQHLKVPYLFQGKLDKLETALALCGKEKIPISQVAYLGDDLIDLPLLTRVGWSATVPYGRAEVKKAVHFITRADAGRGAFREVVEKILKAQGKWNLAIRGFEKTNREWGSLPPRQSD